MRTLGSHFSFLASVSPSAKGGVGLSDLQDSLTSTPCAGPFCALTLAENCRQMQRGQPLALEIKELNFTDKAR